MGEDPKFCVMTTAEKGAALGVSDRTIRNYIKNEEIQKEVAQLQSRRFSGLRNPALMKLFQRWMEDGDYEAFDRLAPIIGLQKEAGEKLNINLSGSTKVHTSGSDKELLDQMREIGKQMTNIAKANGGNGSDPEEEDEIKD